jgi:alkylation response protein AidB-like acyl-CoA dehydrogenase
VQCPRPAGPERRIGAALTSFGPVDAPGFALTDTQRQFRETLRKFAEDQVAPHAAGADRDAAFPRRSFDACAALELPALGIPTEYGGAGADMVTQAIMAEELARVCASTSLTLQISKVAMMPVMNWGSEHLRQTYLPRVASGSHQASYCLSEADAGSDVAAMRSRALRRGDRYLLTGTKYWVTNAGISDLYTIFAVTDPDAGRRGISCFVVEADWGIEVAPKEDKMGLRGSPTAAVSFDQLEVPATNLVGEEGMGFTIAMHTLDRSRPGIAAQAVGIAQGAIDEAGAYMKERQAFGQAIAELQGLRFMLADMAMRNEAARTLLYRACSLIDAGDPDRELTAIGAMAKCFASDTAMAVTTDAVQLLGGYGFTKDFPVERFMRDAKVTQIYEGTNQIQRVVIAKHLLG